MHDSPQFVVCAAMLMQDDSIVVGIRHFSPEMRKIMKRAYGDKYHLQVKEQGFVNQFGKFLTREEAYNVAIMNGQILRNTVSLPHGTLYSEHLY